MQLGANNLRKGKEYYKVSVIISIVLLAFLTGFVYMVKDMLIKAFS